jgi:uncharacterized protein
MASFSISNKRRLLEMSAVILTAVGKFVFMDYLNWRFAFIVAAIISWTIYIIYRNRTKKGIIKYWGFRSDNFKSVMRKVIPFGLLSVIGFIGIGLYRGTINITWHIIPILILYPVWGIAQQIEERNYNFIFCPLICLSSLSICMVNNRNIYFRHILWIDLLK